MPIAKKSKKKKENKVASIAQYAKLCGVTKTVIYTRIENNEIKTFLSKGYSGQLIDIVKYPPVPEKPRGRKSFSDGESI